MSKPVVVYLLLAVAILFLLSSRAPHMAPRHPHSRRLARPDHVAFDPLLGQLERRAEERGLLDVETFKRKLDDIWEKQDWSKMAEEIGVLDEYFGEDGRLNLTERLTYLFPLLDRLPQDGGISRYELEVWNQRQALDRLLYHTERKMKLHDHDGDGAVTLPEFLSSLPDEETVWNRKDQEDPGWWKEQFSYADRDGNGFLSASEFNDFLHPGDSTNPKIQLWLLKKKLREMDENKDGKLSFVEFGGRAQEIYQTYTEFEEDDLRHHELNVEDEFRKLDINRDRCIYLLKEPEMICFLIRSVSRFLTAEELKPIIHRLYPGELSQSKHYTMYLMHKADDDGDGKLTLEEMLRHQYAFYSTVFEEQQVDDDDDDYDYHDELRR
ncbi:hypothetical protein OPV22_000361 [Ensete ventricosum]|uniref:EF-hand domain-containing protein n=1 Tax=Ensete ventricosum TaxID=4639 RepID=A0AAV8RSW3_ENSVE|nr:hypothetical protein OPV22_000361 [Ensete ventricosum]